MRYKKNRKFVRVPRVGVSVMELYLIVIAVMVVILLLLRPKRPKKTLAQQTKEYNERYYADKKPRRY